MDQNISQNEKVNNSNGLATAGLIVSMVSIFIPLMGMMGCVGLVFSIIGLIQSKGKHGKGFPDGYEQKARDYMKEQGFTFNVLFDAKKDPSQPGNNSLVFSQMNDINHSTAIPRKMIVKDGFVRFTEEGYGGSPSRLADEVTYAVEILKNEQ